VESLLPDLPGSHENGNIWEIMKLLLSPSSQGFVPLVQGEEETQDVFGSTSSSPSLSQLTRELGWPTRAFLLEPQHDARDQLRLLGNDCQIRGALMSARGKRMVLKNSKKLGDRTGFIVRYRTLTFLDLNLAVALRVLQGLKILRSHPFGLHPSIPVDCITSFAHAVVLDADRHSVELISRVARQSVQSSLRARKKPAAAPKNSEILANRTAVTGRYPPHTGC